MNVFSAYRFNPVKHIRIFVNTRESNTVRQQVQQAIVITTPLARHETKLFDPRYGIRTPVAIKLLISIRSAVGL